MNRQSESIFWSFQRSQKMIPDIFSSLKFIFIHIAMKMPSGKTINLCGTKHCVSERPEGQKPQLQAEGNATKKYIYACVVGNTLCRSAWGKGGNNFKKQSTSIAKNEHYISQRPGKPQMCSKNNKKNSKKITHLCAEKIQINAIMLLWKKNLWGKQAWKNNQQSLWGQMASGKRTCGCLGFQRMCGQCKKIKQSMSGGSGGTDMLLWHLIKIGKEVQWKNISYAKNNNDATNSTTNATYLVST